MFEDLALLAIPPRDLPTVAAVFVIGCGFVFGALWGSFLNVVIARVPLGISVVTPRSRCPKCETQIAAIDNIPIASWIILRAKCRHCQAPISARYPFIELLGAAAGAAAVSRYGFSLPALELFIFILTLIAITWIDLDLFLVPPSLIVVLCGSGLVGGVLRWQLIGEEHAYGFSFSDVVDRLIGGVGAGLMLGSVIVVSTFVIRLLQSDRMKAALKRRKTPLKERKGKRMRPRMSNAMRLPKDEWAMGWGDPLIIAGLGCHLGWQLMPLALFLGSAIGSVVGLAARKRLKNRPPIVLPGEDPWTPPDGVVPFGPFLALGGLLAAFFGDAIQAWLLPLLGLV